MLLRREVGWVERRRREELLQRIVAVISSTSYRLAITHST
jgi:hypothetical protein